MKNKTTLGVVFLAAGLAALTGCSPNGGVNPQSPSVTASNVKLSAEQLKNIHLYKK